MRYYLVLALLFSILLPGSAFAKRVPPPKVEPIVHAGVQYVVPNDDGKHAYVKALDEKTHKLLWSATLFRVKIDPALEEDVQWKYVKSLQLDGEHLVATDERGKQFSVDLKTHAVNAVKKKKHKAK